MQKEIEKLSKEQAVGKLIASLGYDPSSIEKTRFKVVDHSANSFAPEPYCYKISFTLYGTRHKYAYWPNTVGYQGY